MKKELQNFFEAISEGKKEKEKLVSSISVKSPDLLSFFSAIEEGKKTQKEQLEKEKEKLEELESLLFSGIKRKKVLVKKVSSKVKPIKIKRKAINLMEPEPIKFTQKAKIKKQLTTDVDNLEAVQEELRKLSETGSSKINEANLATNIQEIVTIISYILGNLELTQEQFQTGDVNQDGEINIVDVILFINNKIK